jgi:molybdenum cofactor cytidylyltransferase
MIRAVILAAGRSSRMGTPKAGLRVSADGQTFAAAVVTTLQRAGLDHITIVAGAHPDAVRAAVIGLDGVRVIEHPAWPTGQLSSLLAGLEAVASPDLEALLVTLVDIPRVAPATVAQLIEAWRRTRAPIVRPALGEKHGHPVIFDRATFADLRAAPLDVGAKAVIRAWRDQVLDVPTDDAGVLVDVDTPEDYARFSGDRSSDP